MIIFYLEWHSFESIFCLVWEKNTNISKGTLKKTLTILSQRMLELSVAADRHLSHSPLHVVFLLGCLSSLCYEYRKNTCIYKKPLNCLLMTAKHRGMDDVMSIFKIYSAHFDVVLLNFFETLQTQFKWKFCKALLRQECPSGSFCMTTIKTLGTRYPVVLIFLLLCFSEWSLLYQDCLCRSIILRSFFILLFLN